MSFLENAAKRAAEKAAAQKPPAAGGLLGRLAAQAETTERKSTSRKKVQLDIPRGIDPERCRFEGRTPRFNGGNGQAWREEEPNWTDPEFDLDTTREHHTGRRLAIRICPDCRELRQNGGRAECWCGSTKDAVRLDGTRAKEHPVRSRKQTPAERNSSIARMREIMRERQSAGFAAVTRKHYPTEPVRFPVTVIRIAGFWLIATPAGVITS